MKAIQVKQPGGPEAMELVELPVPEPKANEAVVKLAASGVNFIDVYFREGRYKAPLPFVLGQEGAGVVTAVGADVKSVKSGRPRGLDGPAGIVCRICGRARGPAGADSRGRDATSRPPRPCCRG